MDGMLAKLGWRRIIRTALLLAMLSCRFAPHPAAAASGNGGTDFGEVKRRIESILDARRKAEARRETGRGEAHAGGKKVKDEERRRKETVRRIRDNLHELMLLLGGSPLAVKMISSHLEKIGDEKLRAWARESYFLVNQAIAEAERSGKVDPRSINKARLYHRQFGRILKQAGWLDRLAISRAAKKRFKTSDPLEAASIEAETIHRNTFQAEVASLKSAGRITGEQARKLLELNRRGELTVRRLGAKLLRETSLSSKEILELMRTYVSKRPERVKGKRNAHYDAMVLELLEPWRDPSRKLFRSKLDRESVARLLEYSGDLDSFAAHIMKIDRLSPEDAEKLVNEYAWELEKQRRFRAAMAEKGHRTRQTGEVEARRRSPATPEVCEKPAIEHSSAEGRKSYEEFKPSAPAPSSHPSGALERAKYSLKQDFLEGGLAVEVAVVAGINMALLIHEGQGTAESLKNTLHYLTSKQFILGDLLGGTIGAALGAMIPVPGVLAGMSTLALAARMMPMIGLTILGSQVGIAVVQLLEEHAFSWRELRRRISLLSVLTQSIGAALGMAIGGTLLPGIGTTIGGLVGGVAAALLTNLFLDEAPINPVLLSLRQQGRVQRRGSLAKRLPLPASPGVRDAEGARARLDVSSLRELMRGAYKKYVEAQREGRYREATAALKEYRRYSTLYHEALAGAGGAGGTLPW